MQHWRLFYIHQYAVYVFFRSAAIELSLTLDFYAIHAIDFFFFRTSNLCTRGIWYVTIVRVSI